MKHSLFLTFLLFILTLGIAHSSFGQKSKKTTAPSTSPGIELVQFHTEHRCMTCNKIEELSRKSYAHIPFKLFNVDDSKNEKIAQEFEATGTSLYLYNSKTKKIKDLTDFAFMNAMDRTKFIQGLKKEIVAFK